MNYIINSQTPLAPMIPELAQIAAARGVSGCESFELEDTILRAAGFAWDLGAAATAFNTHAAELTAASNAAEAERMATLVPQAVSPWQMRRALNQLGLRAMVEAAVAEGDQDVKDGWEFALEIRRDNALLAAMAGSLGMVETDLDNLFRLAASFR